MTPSNIPGVNVHFSFPLDGRIRTCTKTFRRKTNRPQTCKTFGTYVIKAVFVNLAKNYDDVTGTEG